jgi:hypothetical protein
LKIIGGLWRRGPLSKARVNLVNRKHLMPTWTILCLIIAGGTGCCSWTDKSGTRHVLIVGVGIVSVNDSTPTAATVTRAHALGLTADQGGIAAGYSSSFTTAVPAGVEDVRIEASQHPFASINIVVQKTQLNETNQIQKGEE